MKYDLKVTMGPNGNVVVTHFRGVTLAEASAHVKAAGLPELELEPNSPEAGDVVGRSELYTDAVDEQGYPWLIGDAWLTPGDYD